MKYYTASAHLFTFYLIAQRMKLLQVLVAFAFTLCASASSQTQGGAASAGEVTVLTSSVKLFRTKSLILRIRGSNFPSFESMDTTSLTFDPELIQDVDYVTRPVDGDGVNVILNYDRAWRTEPGPLLLKSVDLISDTGVSRKYPMPDQGILVAEIIQDAGTYPFDTEMKYHYSRFRLIHFPDDVISLESSDVLLYETAGPHDLTITGTGFQPGMTLDLDPPLELNEDYTLTVTSSTVAVLKLLPSKMWRDQSLRGMLYVRNIKSGDLEQYFDREGVCIAVVLDDPTVHYDTCVVEDEDGVEHYKLSGFDDTASGVKIALHPDVVGAILKVTVVDAHRMVVDVIRDQSAPNGKEERLFTVDTGAGPVPVLPYYPKETVDDSCTDNLLKRERSNVTHDSKFVMDDILDDDFDTLKAEFDAWEYSASSDCAVRRVLLSVIVVVRGMCMVHFSLSLLTLLIFAAALCVYYTKRRLIHPNAKTNAVCALLEVV